MSESLVISGRLTFPAVMGGSTTSPVLGAPTITPSSTTGPSLDYNEGGSSTYKCTVGVVTTIPFGTLTSANAVYVGSDQAVEIILSGGTEKITLAADGFILLYMAGITSMTVKATVLAANVVVILLGD